MYLTLDRSADDKKRYDLPGVGSLWRPSRWNGVSKARTVDGLEFRMDSANTIFGKKVAVTPDGDTLGWAQNRKGREIVVDGEWRQQDFMLWPTDREVLHQRIAFGEEIVATLSLGGAWHDRPAAVEYEPQDVPDTDFFLYAIWLAHNLRAYCESISAHGWDLVGG